MHLGRLILREIAFRKGNFLLAVASVVLAVGCAVAVLGVLRQFDRRTEILAAAFDRQTEDLAAERERQTARMMGQLQEDFRKLTLKMGFTTVIVHQDQDLAELFAKGYATKTMPESYGEQIGRMKVTTINHALPTLQERVTWPERGVPIQLIGVKGEVYVQDAMQRPLLEKVPDGGMVLGQQFAKSLKVGDKTTLFGRPYTVTGIRPGKGGSDDMGVWINLADAQSILNRPGQINAIMAVECMCPGDRVGVIQKELSKFLKDIKVYEFSDLATARSEARNRVMAAAKAAREQAVADRAAVREQMVASRAAVRREKVSLARLLIPVVVLGGMAWVAFLTLGNARDRGGEIGILRAIGLRTSQVLVVFLGKALAVGLLGACLGYAGGLLVGAAWEGHAEGLFDIRVAAVALLGAPLLALAASFVPAVLTARQDPAVMLRDQ